MLPPDENNDDTKKELAIHAPSVRGNKYKKAWKTVLLGTKAFYIYLNK